MLFEELFYGASGQRYALCSDLRLHLEVAYDDVRRRLEVVQNVVHGTDRDLIEHVNREQPLAALPDSAQDRTYGGAAEHLKGVTDSQQR